MPLTEFKGSDGIGSLHRKYNLLLAAREHECESLPEVWRLIRNPAFSQLCCPEAPIGSASMQGFLGRFFYSPKVIALDKPLYDFTRGLINGTRFGAFRLQKPGGGIKLYKARTPDILTYPFLIHEPKKPDEGIELTQWINGLVSRGIPPWLQADICQDLIVGILSGDIDRGELDTHPANLIKAARRVNLGHYREVSFDATIRGTDSLTLHDVLDHRDGESSLAREPLY